jgi:hypothetical protein
MIRKWEWIRDYCKQEDFSESAEIADQIDRVLYYLYGDENTPEWEALDILKEECQDPEEVLDQIINTTEFCTACARSPGCYACKFAELVGECGNFDTLYTNFEEKYEFESEGN